MQVFDVKVESLPSMHARVASLCRFISKAYGIGPMRQKSIEGMVVLNVDRSALSSLVQTGYENLICDSTGGFMMGFQGSAGLSDILQTEVVTLIQGLEPCWEAGFRSITCYSDSLTTIHMVVEGCPSFTRKQIRSRLFNLPTNIYLKPRGHR